MHSLQEVIRITQPGSVNGVPLKKRGSRTEEYDGDFLLDMDFDDDNK